MLTKQEAESMEITGSLLIVERYRPAEKLTKDGIIILPRDLMEFRDPGVGMLSINDNPRLRVVAVGPGEYLDNGERENMQGIKPGDIVLADSLVTDERNLMAKSEDDDFGGYYWCHIKMLEAVLESE